MKIILAGLIVFLGLTQAFADESIKQKDANKVEMPKVTEEAIKVYFAEPKDHSTVARTFKVKMGVDGMKVCPAGEAPTDKACGHHHLIIDGKFLPTGTVVPSDATHIHYGKGQTETMLTLSPGMHTLTLQFADFAHRSFGEKLSSTISVNVK